jgi:hypothetical protein
MSEIPTDPLTEKKYIYSVSNNKNELEILSLLESDDVVLNTIWQTNAAQVTVIPKITWNYNGLFIKTSTYIVPLPSIINTEVDENTVTEIDTEKIKSMVTHLWSNIPNNWNVISNTWALTWLVLTWATITWITKDSTNADKAAVMNIIKSAYENEAALNNDWIINYILNLEVNDSILATAFDTTVLNEVSAVVFTPNSCDDTTKPADDLNKTYTVNPTSVNQAYVQDNNECWFACTWLYTWTNCEIAPSIASCTWVNAPTPFSAPSTYGSCDTADIIVCNWTWTWYTIATCNVWTNTASTAYNDAAW